MNLGDIRAGIYDRLGYNQTPDSSITRRLDRYINDVHHRILASKGMGRLRRKVLTFSSVASSPYATLPQSVVSLICIADRATNRILDEISLQDLRGRDPGMNFSSSIPDSYVIINLSAPVAKDPSVACQLFVQSDSASDGTGISALVEGTITGGYYRRASVAMSGVTPVALDASVLWEGLTKFFLSGKATGNVTLTQGSGGTELARITPNRSYSRYTLIHFSGTPSAAATYYADVELHVEDMAHVADEPYLPEDFHWLLESGGLATEYLRREKIDKFRIENALYDQGFKDLQAFVGRPSGIASGMNRRRGFSQLGPMFPAGS